MNTVMLIGRLTADPEARESQNGTVASFTLAVDRQKGEADFIRCVAFGKTAENVMKYTGKGLRAAVQGSIRTGSYTNKNGDKVYTTDVNAFRVEFLDWKEKQEQSVTFETINDDDCPF